MLAVDYRPGDGSTAADGVYIVDLATADRRFIAPFVGGPDWSPDGSKLAFTGGGAMGVADLASGEVAAFDLADFSAFPSWSPDGNTIAFTSVIDISNPPVLYLMNSDGTNARRIPLPLPRTELDWPDWSPTGDRIVAIESGIEKRLLVTDTLAQDTARITPQDVEADDPSWSPDGSWIAYTRRRSSRRFDIHLVRPDGSEDHVLVNNGFDPTWSPDGQSVAFSRRGNSNVAVWAVGIDGDDLRQLTDPE
jgi:TolB protein